MSELIFSPFLDYGFMQRALAGCLIMAFGATPIGVFMTLRHMSLTGDAMAHAILPGAAIGYLMAGLSLFAMTLGGIIAGFLVAILAGMVTRSSELKEDTNLAAFYLMSLAFGVLLISTHGGSVDLQHVLFGSILALDDPTLYLLAAISTVTLIALAIFFRPLVLECCDPLFLRSVSGLSAFTHYLFLALVVLNLVAGFHALGTLMAVGIMILPAAAARFWSRNLGAILLCAIAIGFTGSMCGLLFSYYVDSPSSSAIILALGFFYLLSYFFGSAGGLLSRKVPRAHLQA